jgi:hypothetical protein
VPITPEEKLIPPIPMVTKLAVTVETFAIIGLGLILYLDYINNQYLQGFVNQTSLRLLAGINVWTGVILGVTSFLTTYILLRGKSKSSGSDQPALLRKVGRQLGKLRPKRAKVPLIATISNPSPSLSLLGPPATTETLPKPKAQNQEQLSTTPTNPFEEKKQAT